MKVEEFLRKETRVGDIVIFRDAGWQVGMTRIDGDDFYIFSLNPVMLELYEVVCYTYEKREWTTKDVLVLDIKRSEDIVR